MVPSCFVSYQQCMIWDFWKRHIFSRTCIEHFERPASTRYPQGMWNTVESNRTSNLERHIQMRIRYRQRERETGGLIGIQGRRQVSRISTAPRRIKQNNLVLKLKTSTLKAKDLYKQKKTHTPTPLLPPPLDLKWTNPTTLPLVQKLTSRSSFACPCSSLQ